MKIDVATTVMSTVCLVYATAVTRADTGTGEADFAQAGAERIVAGSSTTLEAHVADDRRPFSEVVFSDDGTRLVYAIGDEKSTNATGERAAASTIVVRDAATFQVRDTFTWIATPSKWQQLTVMSLAWSPKADRILCIGSAFGYGYFVAVVDLTTKKLTSVRIEGAWPAYRHRCKWRTDSDVYVFFTEGSSPRDLIFSLDTLATRDLIPDGDDDRAFIQSPLGSARVPKGDSRTDRLADIKNACFATPRDHQRACVVTFPTGGWLQALLPAVLNRDGSFVRLLSEASTSSDLTVEGCYASHDLRTVVMRQRYVKNTGDGMTNEVLVAFPMKLRDEPRVRFMVPFSTERSLAPDEQAALRRCMQSKLALLANVYAPRINPLNGRVIGPDRDQWKGVVLFDSVGGDSSVVRVTRENLPVCTGDVIADLRTDTLPRGAHAKSGNTTFRLEDEKWFILEPDSGGSLTVELDQDRNRASGTQTGAVSSSVTAVEAAPHTGPTEISWDAVRREAEQTAVVDPPRFLHTHNASCSVHLPVESVDDVTRAIIDRVRATKEYQIGSFNSAKGEVHFEQSIDKARGLSLVMNVTVAKPEDRAGTKVSMVITIPAGKGIERQHVAPGLLDLLKDLSQKK